MGMKQNCLFEMTANDTTYFESNPKQFDTSGTKWHNTFKFIENTLYKRKQNYSQKEVEAMIEQKIRLEKKQEFVGEKNILK